MNWQQYAVLATIAGQAEFEGWLVGLSDLELKRIKLKLSEEDMAYNDYENGWKVTNRGRLFLSTIMVPKMPNQVRIVSRRRIACADS